MASSNNSFEICVICKDDVSHSKAQVDGCRHSFCFDCIRGWALSSNTCPLDRIPFKVIAYQGVDYPVEAPQENDEQVAFDLLEVVLREDSFIDNVVCEACRLGGNEELLLLCDSCNLGHHTFCLDPPLYSVPEGEWFCPTCGPIMSK